MTGHQRNVEKRNREAAEDVMDTIYGLLRIPTSACAHRPPGIDEVPDAEVDRILHGSRHQKLQGDVTLTWMSWGRDASVVVPIRTCVGRQSGRSSRQNRRRAVFRSA